MKISDLKENQKMTVQLIWGEQTIEFATFVMKKDLRKIYVKPYLLNGNELELNVDRTQGIVCNAFTTDPGSNRRVSWNNINISTVKIEGVMMYKLETGNYNSLSKVNDRRQHDRLVIQTKGRVTDATGKTADILVHDISDNGISFYAPITYGTESDDLEIVFEGKIDEKSFILNVHCTVKRIFTHMGTKLYGCSITRENREYLLYGFLLRLKYKISEVSQ